MASINEQLVQMEVDIKLLGLDEVGAFYCEHETEEAEYMFSDMIDNKAYFYFRTAKDAMNFRTLCLRYEVPYRGRIVKIITKS